MKAVFALISRNRKLFFKDRGMFFSALITPGILILLYATFLANVYRDSFVSAIPDIQCDKEPAYIILKKNNQG